MRFAIRDFLWLTIVVGLALARVASADFVGPSDATNAVSPNGSVIVRLSRSKLPDDTQEGAFEVVYYSYDSKLDAYTRDFSFRHAGPMAQLVFVSNLGDLVMINLGENGAIRLFSKDGTISKSWNLRDFVSDKDVNGCAKTGSTLQWFDEGKFVGTKFSFSGPSHKIRALQPPYTLMRSADRDVSFYCELDLATRTIAKE